MTNKIQEMEIIVEQWNISDQSPPYRPTTIPISSNDDNDENDDMLASLKTHYTKLVNEARKNVHQLQFRQRQPI